VNQLELAEPVAAGWILRRRAPRILLNALGPLAAFFAAWKLVGLVPGIAAATGFALVTYSYERRRGRPGMVVRVALGLVFLRAIVGLVTGSARIYLGQEIVIDAVLGLAVMTSVAVGKPLAEIFAREIYPFPDEVRRSETFRGTFRTITVVWGAYFLARGAVRLAAVLTLDVDLYVVVLASTGAPIVIGLLIWSVTYTTRRFRASEEWGGVIAAAEAAAIASAKSAAME
jgi:intracellular septation protein A